MFYAEHVSFMVAGKEVGLDMKAEVAK